jgi:Amt family ammonium transporter
VAITPAAGYVDVIAAIIIGAIAGALCYVAILFRINRGLDESCDAWAEYDMSGLWGAIAPGIFATAAVNGYNGLIYGNVHQFMIQIIAAGSVVIYAFVTTYILARIVDSVMGHRVTENEEYVDSDIVQHGENAYALVMTLKKIEAIIRPERFEQIKKPLKRRDS